MKNARLARPGKQIFLCLLVCAVLLNGCASWQVRETPPNADNPMDTRLYLKDGRVLEVRGAFENRGVVAGMGRKVEEKGWRSTKESWIVPVSIPVDDIREIKTKQMDYIKTLIFIGTAATATFLVIGGLQ